MCACTRTCTCSCPVSDGVVCSHARQIIIAIMIVSVQCVVCCWASARFSKPCRGDIHIPLCQVPNLGNLRVCLPRTLSQCQYIFYVHLANVRSRCYQTSGHRYSCLTEKYTSCVGTGGSTGSLLVRAGAHLRRALGQRLSWLCPKSAR